MGSGKTLAPIVIKERDVKMKKKIFLNSEEKKLLESEITNEQTGLTLMTQGAKFYNEAEEKLQAIVKEKWPTATKLHHPLKGKWSVIIEDADLTT